MKLTPAFHESVRKSVLKRFYKRREFYDSLKGGKPCADCGGVFPPCAMDYDHRDRASKVHNVSGMITGGRSHEIIMAEIAKCDLVCANCHRVRSKNRKDSLTVRKHVEDHGGKYHVCTVKCPFHVTRLTVPAKLVAA